MTGGAAGSQVAIQYDGWGNRVAETANGATTRFLVDDLNPTGYPQVVEELVNGAVSRRYAYGFQRISETQLANNAWTPSFYGYDGMGSVRQLTSLSGAVTDTYSYDAFGNLLASTGTTPNNFLYRGEQYDSALGLEYLRARYYNPATGRFLSKDPWGGSLADPATLHKYSYAHSNPIAGRDPSGWLDAGEQIEGDRISLETERGIKNASKAVDCVLETSAQLLLAVAFNQADAENVVNIIIEGAQCTAEASKEPKPREPGASGSPHEEPSPTCPLQRLQPVEFPPHMLHPGTVTEANPEGIYTYPATGDYGADKQALHDAAGLNESPSGAWHNHHVGYDPQTNTMTGQLVDAETHSGFPHVGGADEFKADTGFKYGTPEAVEEATRRNRPKGCD